MSWLGDLKHASETGSSGEPPDGFYTARLEHTALLDTKNGKRLKTEWRTVTAADGGTAEYAWDAWNGLEGAGAKFGADQLDALGITLAAITTEDQLRDALLDLENGIYTVRVERNGNFLNTFVEDRGPALAAPAVPHDELEPIAPGDAQDELAPAGNSLFDDDIPF